jgi:RNA polymerase sigma-70 factor (ECF subfamily)
MNDRERFEELYRRNFKRVAAYLLARADRDLADDALTATFEVAWRRLDDVPRDELPWLLGVSRKTLANARRSRSRQAALVERMAAAASVASGEADDAVVARLAAALAELPEAQQEALLLIAWEGLSEREAAQALGCSRVAFAARLHRARTRLRAALRDVAPAAPQSVAARLPREEPT